MFIADASSAHKIQATAQVCAFYWVVKEEKSKTFEIHFHQVSQNISFHRERVNGERKEIRDVNSFITEKQAKKSVN